MAQASKVLELQGFVAFGKDEVGSSNLPSSSKGNPVTATVTGFFFRPGGDLVTKKRGVFQPSLQLPPN